MTSQLDIVAVVIGRNEGQRLVRCLASLRDAVALVVYVDSGSMDGSVETARSLGAECVILDLSVPFTAARTRNAGYALLRSIAPNVSYVQFIDGDCELEAGWLDFGYAVLEKNRACAVVCGWRSEKYPNATVWKGLADAEWHSGPIGEIKACGGDALMRVSAFEEVVGFREDLTAGEEPEMCFRMRQKGWIIQRIDVAMTSHDAAMTRFAQWWNRSRRAEHTYAEGVAMHGSSAERYNVPNLRRTVI